MPDVSMPEIKDVAGDVAKFGGGGLLTLIASRLWGSQDKVLAEVRALQVQMAALTTQVSVLDASLKVHLSDVSALRAIVEGQRAELVRQGQVLARLEATVEAMP